MNRRQHVGLIPVAAAVALACCGFLTGSEAFSLGASPATATDEALTETGYEAASVTEQTVTRNFSVVGQTGRGNEPARNARTRDGDCARTVDGG